MTARRSIFNELGHFRALNFSGDMEFLERYMAAKANISLASNGNAHKMFDEYVTELGRIEVVDRLMLIALDLQTGLSRTVPISSEGRKQVQAEYRENLRKEFPNTQQYNYFLNAKV